MVSRSRMTYLTNTIIGAFTPDIGPEYRFLVAAIRGMDHVSYMDEIGRILALSTFFPPRIMADSAIIHIVV